MKILMNPSWQAKAVLLWPEVSSSPWGRCESINLLKGNSMHAACIPSKSSIARNVGWHKTFAVQMQKKKKITFHPYYDGTEERAYSSHVPAPLRQGSSLSLKPACTNLCERAGVKWGQSSICSGEKQGSLWRQAGYPVFLPTPQLSNCS